MQRRVLNIHCRREDRELKVQIHEIQEFFKTPDLNPSVLRGAFGRPRTFNSFLYRSVAIFNGLDDTSKHAHNLYKSFKESNYNIFVQHPTSPEQYFEFNSLLLRLPNHDAALLKLLGALDPALHELEYNGPENECTVSIHYCDDLNEGANNYEIVSHTLEAEIKNRSKPKARLSRYIAEWIIHAYNNDPEGLHDYKSTTVTLESCLNSPNPSLTPIIRSMLYPQPKMKHAIQALCKEDRLTAKMLSVESSYQTAMLALMGTLRKTLHSHTKEPIAQLKTPISKWFNGFAETHQKFWNLIIESIYGHPAALGGFYNNNYTEIHLLREAKMTLNRDGLMVLNIRDTKAYRNYYANPNEQQKNKLELELRWACGYLGLEFLLAQNFHHDPVFTLESTFRLMDLKVHVSENYCKRWMQASQAMRFFQMSDKSNQERNYIKAVPLDIQANIVAHEFGVHPRDVALVARSDRTPKI